MLSTGIDEVTSAVRLGSGNTLPAEMVGMMHLMQAFIAAREQRGNEAHAHLDEAGQIADRVGECNGMRRHFGPTNVRIWRLEVGIELGEGAGPTRITRAPLDVEALGSRERNSALHLHLAHALVQDGPDRDAEVIRPWTPRTASRRSAPGKTRSPANWWPT